MSKHRLLSTHSRSVAAPPSITVCSQYALRTWQATTTFACAARLLRNVCSFLKVMKIDILDVILSTLGSKAEIASIKGYVVSLVRQPLEAN